MTKLATVGQYASVVIVPDFVTIAVLGPRYWPRLNVLADAAFAQ